MDVNQDRPASLLRTSGRKDVASFTRPCTVSKLSMVAERGSRGLACGGSPSEHALEIQDSTEAELSIEFSLRYCGTRIFHAILLPHRQRYDGSLRIERLPGISHVRDGLKGNIPELITNLLNPADVDVLHNVTLHWVNSHRPFRAVRLPTL